MPQNEYLKINVVKYWNETEYIFILFFSVKMLECNNCTIIRQFFGIFTAQMPATVV